jgi:uncharacterized repeat protein (TIGR04138 family)
MNSNTSFQEKVEQLTEQHPAYAAEAYFFLREVLDFAIKSRKKKRRDPSPHVSAAELLEAFRLYALKEFGAMACTVFDYWGVKSCEDIGHLVFHLVEVGVFGKTDQDTIEAFRQGYRFEEAFSIAEVFGGEISSKTTASSVHSTS